MHDFATKRNALFACLDDASSELKGTVLDQTNAKTALSRTAPDGQWKMNYRQESNASRNKQTTVDRPLHHLRGKESIFKKPELPIARCLKPRKLPDYQVNPHKWKKYSLEDVDISDQTNSSAAFEFLRQIDEQKDSSESEENSEGQKTKIEFKKSSKIRRNLKTLESLEKMDVEIDSPKLKGSKLVMPEYVVGQKKQEKKKLHNLGDKNEKKERAAGKLLLSHLQEDDEEEEN
ncbi:uncharacterized protein LOC111677082 [Lucilia cuprina]|uniref:uncharacterized protein LOC111677082 n=1 Tax=Lucilia cuprina TaxID=7375 RepID=UPI001F064DC2|nr:uncharacterized protein LOC111677082 [Lucilia cuprina]